MATLTIPHTFVAGTPALASEVNANFQAIVAWTQSNISTDNLGVLTARSVALPTSPTLAILSLQQTASQPALFISNSGTDNSITVNQSGLLASGKAILTLNSPSTQTTAGAAEVAMNLATNSTIPALLINHGATPTLNLTKTQLSLFNGVVQATSAGVVSATTVNATTVATTNLNTTGVINAVAPTSDAIAVKVRGRSSDNTAIVQFKSNNDATTYASATSSASGLTLNIPDTADSYTFQVNGVTKGVINNSGIDGQYVTNIAPASISASPIVISPTFNYVSTSSSDFVLWNGSITTTKANAYIQLSLEYTALNARLDRNSSAGNIDPGQVTITATAPGYSSVWAICALGTYLGDINTVLLNAGPVPIPQTYNLEAKIWRARDTGNNFGAAIVNYRFVIRQIV